MLEARVARLEDDMKEVKTWLVEIKAELKHLPQVNDLTSIRSDFATLRADFARLDGRIFQLPTAWTMFTAIITTVVATWGAGAAIVFTLLRFAKP